MRSSFLDLPLRSLRDLASETEAEIADLEAQAEALMERRTVADLELRFEESDELGYQIDAISDKLGPLQDRLETLEDEIAWREQPRFAGGFMP